MKGAGVDWPAEADYMKIFSSCSWDSGITLPGSHFDLPLVRGNAGQVITLS